MPLKTDVSNQRKSRILAKVIERIIGGVWVLCRTHLSICGMSPTSLSKWISIQHMS